MSIQIPSVAGLPPDVRRVVEPIKEVVERLSGRRGTRIDALPDSATNADIINKINEVISALQR